MPCRCPPANAPGGFGYQQLLLKTASGQVGLNRSTLKNCGCTSNDAKLPAVSTRHEIETLVGEQFLPAHTRPGSLYLFPRRLAEARLHFAPHKPHDAAHGLVSSRGNMYSLVCIATWMPFEPFTISPP